MHAMLTYIRMATIETALRTKVKEVEVRSDLTDDQLRKFFLLKVGCDIRTCQP